MGVIAKFSPVIQIQGSVVVLCDMVLVIPQYSAKSEKGALIRDKIRAMNN